MTSDTKRNFTVTPTTGGNLALFLGVGLFVVLLIRTAWQADDAYTAWRLVSNFVAGYGLRNNLDERVQTFTSCLWTMLNAAVFALTKNIYYTSIALSIALSTAALTLLGRVYRDRYLSLVFLFAAVSLSISYMDFSAAGFENPLNHFLLVIFSLVFFRSNFSDQRAFRRLFFIAALAGLTRLDILAYYLPPLSLVFYRSALPVKKKVQYALAGLSPLLAWHFFTVIYFGFPLQNAAYAKRFNGVPVNAYLRAGVDYYLNSISRDPVTLVLAFAAMIVGLPRRTDERLRAFAVGIPFYLLYVLFVGGDYMSGRFFSVAVMASVIVILRSNVLDDLSLARIAVGAVAILGCLANKPTFLNDIHYGSDAPASATSEFGMRGIADERSSYYQQSGLLWSSRFWDLPRAAGWWDFHNSVQGFVWSMKGGPCVGTLDGPAGYASYYAPRDCHVYDLNGQVDPLMARLPIHLKRYWVQGHHFRSRVPGYQETLVTGKNQIKDPDLAQYYDKLSLITRGDIWSFKRFETIFHMNMGHYDHWLNAYASRNP